MAQRKEKPLTIEETKKLILEFNFLHSSTFYQVIKDLERGRSEGRIPDGLKGANNPLQVYENRSGV